MLRSAVLVLPVLLTFGCTAPVPRIEMSDVSLVWPLANGDADDDTFLRARSEGDHGTLISRDVFDAIPALTRTDEPDDLYAGLQVVGARLDPCFQEGPASDDPPCRTNLRLVLQPVLPSRVDGETGQVARDASVHAFYEAENEGEITTAVAALAKARVAAGFEEGGPLGVHPLLDTAEGRGQVAEILAPLLGGARLARITSMGVHASDAAWTFSGFEVDGEERTPIVIAASGGVTEQHAISDGADGAIHASVQPALAADDDITLLLDDAVAQAATLEERQAAFDAAARIQNPTMHNPGTIDCVSCHLAAVARTSALAREALADSPEAFTSDRHDLTTSSFSNTQVVRAFGYRFGELALSPRVVNESAAVADRVDALLHP